MDRLTRVILIIILASMLALGLMIGSCSSSTPAQGPSVGKLAPDFQLYSLDGQAMSLSDFQGKPVLLNFWATWCNPCRFEMPFFQEIYKGAADSELIMLAVDLGENPSRVKEFVEEFGLSFTILLDADGKVAQQYNIRGIPATFFIDKDGIIQSVRIGAFSNEMQIAIGLRKIVNG